MDKLGVFHANQTSMCLTNDVFEQRVMNNKNELHTHRGMDSRQLLKVNLLLKEHSTENKHYYQL